MTDDTRYFDPDGDRRMNYALLTVLVVQIAVVLLVIRIAGAGTQLLLILLGLVIAGNFANVYLLTFMLWKPLEKRWPRQPIHSGAVMKAFQTFWFGPISRYNFCMHAAADENHIHITPMAPMRWLSARTISLPLDDISDLKSTMVPGLTQGEIGTRRVVGPTWCMSLAQPDELDHEDHDE